MKNVGIWIDKREAKIVTSHSGKEHLKTIASDIEDLHNLGGGGTKLKEGSNEVIEDSKHLEREKRQLAEFFKNIKKGIEGADAIVIFGPAQTGRKLYEELTEKHSPFSEKTLAVEKADNMTDNQVIAWVRKYFTSAS